MQEWHVKVKTTRHYVVLHVFHLLKQFYFWVNINLFVRCYTFLYLYKSWDWGHFPSSSRVLQKNRYNDCEAFSAVIIIINCAAAKKWQLRERLQACFHACTVTTYKTLNDELQKGPKVVVTIKLRSVVHYLVSWLLRFKVKKIKFLVPCCSLLKCSNKQLEKTNYKHLVSLYIYIYIYI